MWGGGGSGEDRWECETEGGTKKSVKLKFECEGVKAQTLPYKVYKIK